MRSKELLQSLIVTSMLSFMAPLFFLGLAVAGLSLSAYIPILTGMNQLLIEQILKFLGVFGNGSAVEGSLVIAIACSLVGMLFDAYNFYYRSLRNG